MVGGLCGDVKRQGEDENDVLNYLIDCFNCRYVQNFVFDGYRRL